jgi:hypothetical protein
MDWCVCVRRTISDWGAYIDLLYVESVLVML